MRQTTERATDEVLHATTNLIGDQGGKEGKSQCLKLPCEVKQWLGFLEATLVCLFKFHALFETMVAKGCRAFLGMPAILACAFV